MLLVPPAWRPLELCSQCFFSIDGQPSRFDRRQEESSDLVRRETVATLRAFELRRERIAEKQRVIGVERYRNTSIEVLTQRMRLDRFDHAGANIRQWAQLERDAPRRQFLHQLRILNRTRGVTDPIDPQRPDRAPHAGGSRRLAGMRRGPQSKRPRALVMSLRTARVEIPARSLQCRYR